MSGVDGKYNVELDGLGYVLARQPRTNRDVYKRSEAPSFVNKFGSGDPSYRDSTFWSHWVQINWQNGAKSEQFNDQARFLYDENVSIHEEGRLQLSPKMENPGVTSADASVCALTYAWWTGTDYRFYAGSGTGRLFEWDNSSTWSNKYTVGNPPVTTMLGNDASIWLGTGVASAANSNALVYRISANGSFQSSGNITNAHGLNYLFRTDTPNLTTYNLYAATTGFNTQGGQFYGSNNNVSTWTAIWNSGLGKVTTLAEYNQRIIVAAGYAIGDVASPYSGRLVTYDGSNMGDLIRLNHTVPLSMVTFDNLLFVGTAHGHLYVYNGSSFDLLFKFWGNDIDMEVTRLWIHQDKLHILVTKRSTLKNSDIKYAGVWTFNRRGLNLDFKLDDNSTSAYTDAFTFKNQFFFAAGNVGQVINSNENLYQLSGSLQSSYFDANLPSLDKLFKETTIMYDYLSGGTSATIGYKTDETESFTTLGTAQTDGTTSATFQFPSATAKKKLTYQITLSTGLVSSTPRIKKIITKYTVQPDFYHRWDFAVDTSEKIQLLDGTYHPSSGLQLESALFTSKRIKQLVTYKDIDYVSTTLAGAIASSASIINGTDFSSFPPKGRLRIPSTGEEIIFGSRTSTTLNSVTRAYKNTIATSAANAATIDMSYQVIFQAMDENQFSLNQLAGNFNHVTPISLLEA